MTPRTVWFFRMRRCLHWQKFENENSIIFNEASGQTHIVNELCADTIELLQQSPLDAKALAEMLAQRNDFTLDEEWTAYIDEMLADLDQLGLIEPAVS